MTIDNHPPLTQEQLTEQLAKLFFPWAYHKMAQAAHPDFRFVHYTSASNGINILRGNSIWLSNSALMNDYSEVHHGVSCLNHAWNTDGLGRRFKNALDAILTGAGDRVEGIFGQSLGRLTQDTYLTSISEHDPVEDQHGRLSMWRAYGVPNGVAFVFRTTPFINPSEALCAHSSPVFYGDPEAFAKQFARLTYNVERQVEWLRTLEPASWLEEQVTRVLRYAVLSIKHPGFHEEREWRIILDGSRLASHPERAARTPSKIADKAGVPQRVYEVPFVDYPEEDFLGATVPDLLERVIIGPTNFAHHIAETYREMLNQVGAPNTPVLISGIPLRQ